jgi:hypothetical protein
MEGWARRPVILEACSQNRNLSLLYGVHIQNVSGKRRVDPVHQQNLLGQLG